MIAGFRSTNHPTQVARRGAADAVDDRATPVEDFARWDARFGFTIDVAAAPHNRKCAHFFTREMNGLQQRWSYERVWCNPPFSDLDSWVRKAWDEWETADGPQLIVMLVPANRTEPSRAGGRAASSPGVINPDRLSVSSSFRDD